MSKHRFIFVVAAGLTAMVVSSCKKSSSGPAVSHWTFNNQSYTATSTGFPSTPAHTLIAYDTAVQPQLKVELVFGHMPTSNQSFGVVNAFSGTIDSLHCAIGLISGPASSMGIAGASSGGGTVNVTLSNGKVTASFNNISIQTTPTNFTTISGVLIEQ
ncbi:MAG: hypothetical protein J0H74_12125 [Chitinophagaceae bacterium]|nr:hypothetical protein [Chitinophagaceae bacterium]